ncbi:OmpH family outer membrane protein [Tenuifilum thalassicum]|uniref:OmpH family outer membrane protein n=2 Tax=Tenuifilum thalassicum TaxID=2590900 RepID=A0A7D4B9P3_9BACT|nr:OmpH family outer membrane protein [Tenuifilum thalassicum]
MLYMSIWLNKKIEIYLNMKKTNLIINILFGLAIVALFVLHFTSGKKANVESANSTQVQDLGEFTAAWIDMDTILNNYDMYFDMKSELEQSSKKKEAELTAKSKSFEKQARDFQDKVQKGLVTRSEAQQLQADLANKEQQLYQMRDEMRMQLAEEEQVKLRKIHNSIVEYLKEYNADKGYKLIFSSTFGGPVLYGHPAIDITKEVLEGLNKKYAETKKN